MRKAKESLSALIVGEAVVNTKLQKAKENHFYEKR